MATNRHKYGWDWEGPGLTNVLSSIKAITSLPGAPSSLYETLNVNEDLILFTGHSMGGHGCWVTSTHYPDIALGAFCAAPWYGDVSFHSVTFQAFFSSLYAFYYKSRILICIAL